MISLFVATSVIALFLPEVPLSQKTAMEQIAEAEKEAESEVNEPTLREPDRVEELMEQESDMETAEPESAADAE